MGSELHRSGGSQGSAANTSFGNGAGSGFNLDQTQQTQSQQQGDSFPSWAEYYFQPPDAVMTTGQERNAYEFGLTQEDQMELMESLRASGPGAIQNIVDATNRVFYPQQQLGNSHSQ
jgi:hypothetical protein